jgi:hypothetical protein
MPRVFTLVLFVLTILNSNRPIWAWNDLGHMVVARIAYEKLTDAEQAACAAILRHHPHLNELLLKDRPANASEQEWMFLRAATWPDNIRPPRSALHQPISSHAIYRFHHAAWHYANFEYRAGQRDSTLPSHSLPHHPLPANPADRTDIVEQLDHAYMIVRGSKRERSQPETTLDMSEIRAVRLCWLIHLMGDIHQPLHVATLVDDRIHGLEHGDEGGNKLAIRVNHGSAPKKLHAYWDDLLGTHPRFDHIVSIAESFSRDPGLNPAKKPEYVSHKQTWEYAEESYQIAKDIVYQNGRLHFALWSRVESHDLAVGDVPVLSQQAVDQAHAIAAQRITLAGYRLADRLKYIISRDAVHGATAGRSGAPMRRGQLESPSIR